MPGAVTLDELEVAAQVTAAGEAHLKDLDGSAITREAEPWAAFRAVVARAGYSPRKGSGVARHGHKRCSLALSFFLSPRGFESFFTLLSFFVEIDRIQVSKGHSLFVIKKETK